MTARHATTPALKGRKMIAQGKRSAALSNRSGTNQALKGEWRVHKAKLLGWAINVIAQDDVPGKTIQKSQALKQRELIAQGKAQRRPGFTSQKNFQTLKGWHSFGFQLALPMEPFCFALSGLDLFSEEQPRALPGAITLAPFRALKGGHKASGNLDPHCVALSGLDQLWFAKPRALPWAIFCRPFGAYDPPLPCAKKRSSTESQNCAVAYFKASMNSSTLTPAIFRALRRVPMATSRCMGRSHPISPAGVPFFITTWLLLWRATTKPSRYKALTASLPETTGSLGMRQFEAHHLGGFWMGIGEGFQIKLRRFLQVRQRFVLGFTLRSGANFRALSNQQIRLFVRVNDGGQRDHGFRLLGFPNAARRKPTSRCSPGNPSMLANFP